MVIVVIDAFQIVMDDGHVHPDGAPPGTDEQPSADGYDALGNGPDGHVCMNMKYMSDPAQLNDCPGIEIETCPARAELQSATDVSSAAICLNIT